jgi:endoglucanase
LALWEFDGAFGVINHNRPGAKLEKTMGYNVDRVLLELKIDLEL